MLRYTVTVLRTEMISFELDAESEDEAVARFLVDGDEVDSVTVGTTIETVTSRWI
jgi:hypothetical protein